MKILFKSLVVLSLAVLALPAWADNAIQMVTYFPVPYAAYNNLYIQNDSLGNPGKFEVGTSKGEFLLSVGSPDSSQSLSATSVFLREKTALNFTTDLANSVAAKFGNMTEGEDKSDADLTFNKVLINELAKTATAPAKKITAANLTVKGKTYLFEDAFQDAALPNCSDTVTWKYLSVNGKQGYYLVCGEAAEPPSGPCHLQRLEGTVTCKAKPGGHQYCTLVDENPKNALQTLETILHDSTCTIGGKTWDGQLFPQHVFYSVFGGAGAGTISTTCTAHFNASNTHENTMCLDVDYGHVPSGWAQEGVVYWPLPICYEQNACTPAYHPETPPASNDCSTIQDGLDVYYSAPNGNGLVESWSITVYGAVCE